MVSFIGSGDYSLRGLYCIATTALILDCPLIAMIGCSHYTPLPLHTAIVWDHSFLAPAKNRKFLGTKSKSNPGLPRSVAPITDHCPESFTSSPTHASAQHSFMGTIKKCSCFAPKATDYKIGQKQVSKIWGQIG